MLDRITKKSILIVEDSAEHRAVIHKSLGESDNHVYAQSLAEARALVAEKNFDLVLLDLLLPDGHGFEFCSEISQGRSTQPAIIILSAKDDASDKVLGFSMGVSDYVTKPFNPLELQARVLARIGDAEKTGKPQSQLHCGNLSLEDLKHEVTLSSDTDSSPTSIHLSYFETKLLKYFLHHQDQVLSRQTLLDEVWGGENHVLDRSVDSAVSGLRKKLGGWDHSIKSVYGAGYRLVEKSYPIDRPQNQ